MIDGKTYPYGILIHELEEKIEIDDSLGDMQDEVRTIRDVTLANVKAAMERQAERLAAQEQEAEQRRTAEAGRIARRR
jgi:colicin import membrane protein